MFLCSDVAQDLYQAIEEQQRCCRALIAQKDALVRTLNQEIGERDEAYDKLLTRQCEEISELVRRSQQRVAELVACYEQEMVAIETVYTEERKELLQVSEVVNADPMK